MEAILGTDPTRADTDLDGLTDPVEVDGWQFTYGTGLSTLVTTDPRLRDSDNDGLDDRVEKNLGTNPRAMTESPVAIALSVSDKDRVTTPGSSLVYTSTISNNFAPTAYDPAANLTLNGSLVSTFPAALGGRSRLRPSCWGAMPRLPAAFRSPCRPAAALRPRPSTPTPTAPSWPSTRAAQPISAPLTRPRR
ncbi:MAG: hypothetical protein H6646_03245 [Anaerolineales bacterium]|nr:hypothetical protein [Anaerolineales bacterium]